MIRTPDVSTAPAPVEYPDTAPVEVRPKTPREVGEHAARYIEEHGWWQSGVAGIGDAHAACAVVAIVLVADRPGRDRTYVALAEVIGGQSLGDIYGWNDAPERTEAEVLAALRSIR